jgi:membrane protease YdiL (CAAX protease family)
LFGRKPTEPVPVARPAVETWAIVGYLVIYATVFLGWGFSEVRVWFPGNPDRELAISVLKLLVHVVLPAGLLVFLGARLTPLFRGHFGRMTVWLPALVLTPALLALLMVISPSLKQINALNLSSADWPWAGPGTFLWLVLTVGLCEEFLFRAVLQSRLTAFLKSATGAVVIGSILFGLAHAPGLFLRADPGEFGAFQNPLYVAAYTVAVLSPTGIFMGVLWARTQSLWLLVLLHVAVDFLPNLPRFVQSYGSVFNG